MPAVRARAPGTAAGGGVHHRLGRIGVRDAEVRRHGLAAVGGLQQRRSARPRARGREAAGRAARGVPRRQRHPRLRDPSPGSMAAGAREPDRRPRPARGDLQRRFRGLVDAAGADRLSPGGAQVPAGRRAPRDLPQRRARDAEQPHAPAPLRARSLPEVGARAHRDRSAPAGDRQRRRAVSRPHRAQGEGCVPAALRRHPRPEERRSRRRRPAGRRRLPVPVPGPPRRPRTFRPARDRRVLRLGRDSLPRRSPRTPRPGRGRLHRLRPLLAGGRP